DRGDITVGVSYNKEEPLWARDRSFGRNQVDLFGNPLNRGPNDGVFDSIAVANYRYPGTSYGGAFTIGGTRYTYDGSVRPTQNQSLPGAPANYFVGIGGDGFNDADFAPLRNESQVFAALAHFNYELIDGVKFFTDFQFSNSKTTAGLQPTFDFDLVVKRNNPFLPADVAALMDANGLSQITVGRTNVDQGVSRRLLDRDTWTVVTGLEGDLTERLQWMGFYQYGQYKADITRTNDRINSRFFEALDVVAGPTGPMCASATARAAGCQPLNILGPRAASPGAIGYFGYDQHRQVENTQEVAGLQLTGKLFDLPAGPLSIAAGVEYRKETLQTHEDGLASTGQLFNTTGASVKADYDVKEVFGEVLVPILADQPWAKSLSLEGAVRYSDYNTVGSTTAWKAGGQWAPFEDLRFRVTRSKSVRAPSLSELFSPGSFSGAFILDPCDATRINLTSTRAANCLALGVPANFTDPRGGETKDILTGGNSRLKAETSNSWTVGAVITPRALPRLRASIDWWKIDLTDAINLVPFQTIVNGCVDAASTANPYCGLITRRPDHAIGVVDVTNINIGKLAAEGVDFQANYILDLPLNYLGQTNQLRFALVGTYMSKNEALVDANDPKTRDVSVGEVDNPRWKVNFTPSFVAGPLELDWTIRYISSTKVDAMATAEGRSDNKVSARVYNDLFASYALSEGTRVYAGVNNLFDQDPPFSAVTFQGTGRGALFDNIGRYFFVGADARF
ncbi:MAG: TonB-dependent receptor, partial [Caulobacteraceae bacterium]|nr:TonB-dependent receptor [Caulobacteraceae bacterium]